MREYDPNVCGYVNGKPCYSEEEFHYEARHHGAFSNDEEMLSFIRKLHSNSPVCHMPLDWVYYISDYCLEEPKKSLTRKEFNRLLYLWEIAREARKEFDESLNWRYVHSIYWADNSVEELWVNGLGETKTVMTTHPHGDAC